jgi:hypothetical protein
MTANGRASHVTAHTVGGSAPVRTLWLVRAGSRRLRKDPDADGSAVAEPFLLLGGRGLTAISAYRAASMLTGESSSRGLRRERHGVPRGMLAPALLIRDD